ncbi:hypothetical protein SAMN02745119_01943 [Trichlorobacter thiogenes]|uniref:Uncharacterized protein n=1 Tax=Trichlorobacter thiogenes TaxID=115783 RepID=A0A1T4PCQ7_9BACT|nr:hypothetical protein [Trichlorobacter thiogenes]SJZ89365.1 hypothetical protein SAMN02745119_01943 [Trichlorobacter thiogenes]
MKKTRSMVMGAAVLAALALPMVAGAANKLVVNGTDGTTPKMVVTDTGYVGVGTSAPGSSITVTGAVARDAQLYMQQNSPTALALGASGAGLLLHYNQNSGLPPAGTRLGYILFGGMDGATQKNPAGIVGYSEGTWASGGVTGAGFYFATTAADSTSRLERLRIAGDGRIRLSNQPAAPANNATCTAGDLVLDAANAYLYLCTATNTWKRMSFTAY